MAVIISPSFELFFCLTRLLYEATLHDSMCLLSNVYLPIGRENRIIYSISIIKIHLFTRVVSRVYYVFIVKILRFGISFSHQNWNIVSKKKRSRNIMYNYMYTTNLSVHIYINLCIFITQVLGVCIYARKLLYPIKF